MIKSFYKAKTRGNTAICICDYCGTEFERRYTHSERAEHQYCTHKCYSKAQIGVSKKHIVTDSERLNRSKAKLGEKNPNYGKKYTEEERKIIGLSSKKRWENKEYREKMIKKMKEAGKAKRGKGKMTKKNIKIRLDYNWANIVKERANNCCEICGSNKSINAHHVISRRILRTRWDLRNGIALCSSHHFFGNFSAHSNPIWFLNWFKLYRPDDYKYLESVKNEIISYSLEDYQEILEKLLDNIR